MPFLKQLTLDWSKLNRQDRAKYPFNIPALQNLHHYRFESDATIFVGDNGSGKSTLLEAIGVMCGFNIVGGQGPPSLSKRKDDTSLTSIMRLSWLPKVSNGFFFRAETFDSFANYIDELAEDPYVGMSAYRPYGGKSLNERSHGQAFLASFKNRFGRKGIYLLDEPESALSPQNQLAFMRIIYDLAKEGEAQFIMATHSPILMAYPGAKILRFTDDAVSEIEYEETEHFLLTRDFLNHRERYFRELFLED